MIIDGHQHVLSDPAAQRALAEEAGLDKAILFSTLVHPERAGTRGEFVGELETLNKILLGRIDPAEARERAVNELVERIAGDRDAYIGFGACPLGMSTEKTGEWIERRIVGNHLKGIGELAPGPGNARSIESIFICLHERSLSLPVWIHTFNPLGKSDIQDIILLAQRYSRVRVVLGHAGGSHWLEILEKIKSQKNIYMDLSASFTIWQTRYIPEAIPERCVFSSDAPYGNPYLARQQIEFTIKDKSIRDNVLGLNTERLLEAG